MCTLRGQVTQGALQMWGKYIFPKQKEFKLLVAKAHLKKKKNK